MGGYDPSAFYVIGDTVLANNWKKNKTNNQCDNRVEISFFLSSQEFNN